MERSGLGDVVADRFVLEALAGTGGMASVYRATDRLSGSQVALKIAHAGRGPDDARFLREVRLLAQFSHSAVVRYVEHGTTPDGRLFMAMEWLEGETLAQRLVRGGLPPNEAVDMARRVVEGLALAHERGIVHRDLKPSNLFLVGGDPSRVKVLDFGVAHVQARSQALTRSGAMIGTAGYMAPEQAQGTGDLDARADVFSLGCLLFECLTGQPAFAGDHLLAVLAKVLRADPPRLSELRPDLPAQLDDLLARMLSKDRAARPPDGGALARELAALGPVEAVASAAARPVRQTLTADERRVVCVILVELEAGAAETAPTMNRSQLAEELVRARSAVRRFGAELTPLGQRALIATLSGRGAVTDQAAETARCALTLRAAFADARIALATGSAESSGERPVGPAIDRAAALLQGEAPAGILVDEISAALLDREFEVITVGGARSLVRERAVASTARTLLGRPCPFVGRDKELALLRATFEECIEESSARAVLVTAQAGGGKSRLREEFLLWVAAREDATVLGAHADAVGAGSALGLVRSLVRRVAGLRDGTPAEEQYKRLQDYVAARLPPIDVARVTEFLGELSGAPTPSAPSAMLRAARTDPREMQEAMQSAFIDWLGAESATRPVLVVIEDLHWGDTPSVTYLGKALIHLTDRPLMFLALGRPEVSHLFPHLRDESRAQELTLGRLSRKAAERVARAALGDTIAPDRVAQIVERADGNPFYLEELVRHLAEGGRGDLPETVLSAAALRLEGLEPEARRTLRAASIFGQTSWAAGVATLLGQLDRSGDVEAQLRWLVEREVLVPGRGEKFPEQAEYGFRHALLREAAYAMLTDADKARGHRLAGDWLERTGERDGLVLGEHFERGGEPLRAVPWIRRAAQAALDGGQWDAAADLAERGIRNGAQGEPRAALRIIEAQAHNLMRAWARGRECAAEAMSLSPIAGVPWFRAASLAVIADATLAERTATLEVIEALASLPADLPATGPFAFAVMVLNSGLLSMGQRDLALSLLRRLEDTARTATEADPSFAGWLRLAQAHAALYAGEDLGAALTGAENALQLLDAAADSLGRVIAKLDLGTAYCEAGRFEDGTKLLREVVALAEPSGAVFLRDWAVFFIARSGWYLRGGTAELDTLQRLADGADFFIAAAARAVIARAHLVLGDAEEAGRRARLVLESASFLPTVEGEALSVIALVELAAGRPKEALTAADLGLTRRREQGGLPTETSELFLTRARALAALGRREEADAAFAEARDRVTRLAATLTEPASRNRYLHDVLANAQTIAGPVHTGGATG